MSSRTAGILFSIGTGLLWAVLAIKLKISLDYATAGTIVWLRFVVAFIGLTLLFALRSPKEFFILKSPPKLGVYSGLFLAFNYFAYMKGVEYTSPANAQIMIQIGPLLLVFVGILYFKEGMGRIQKIGFALALLGFALFYGDQLKASQGSNPNFNLGYLWVLAAAVTWTAYGALQKKLMGQYRPQTLNYLIYALSIVVLAPLVQWSEFLTWSPMVWLLMISLGLNTLIAYGFFAEALQRIPASLTSLILSLNPLLTILLMHVLERAQVTWIAAEHLHWLGYLGAVFVVIGVVFAARK